MVLNLQHILDIILFALPLKNQADYERYLFKNILEIK